MGATWMSPTNLGESTTFMNHDSPNRSAMYVC